LFDKLSALPSSAGRQPSELALCLRPAACATLRPLIPLSSAPPVGPPAEEIRKEIEAETLRHTQKRGTIVSPVPITLRIVSPQLPGLSLVDMPGLTKVPIDGQPKSIVTELENMARDYVKHENVIILAVTPANADLATSDALRLAREVDPSGDRTIGE
jgi:dynamin 1-like protein